MRELGILNSATPSSGIFFPKDQLEALLSKAGINPNTIVVLYGDSNNWFAALAFWQLKIREGRELSKEIASYATSGLSPEKAGFVERQMN